MEAATAIRPNWDRLYEAASGQEGYFTTQQAESVGYSTHALYKHIRAGRVVRIRRGVYRLTHYPAGEHEDLTVLWLWSDLKGVYSHVTALWLHDLSDVMPSKLHLTLPLAWAKRRLRVPEQAVLHFGEVGAHEVAWAGAVPCTNVGRTLSDCAQASVQPEILGKAVREALHRGLVARSEIADVEAALEAYGGVGV